MRGRAVLVGVGYLRCLHLCLRGHLVLHHRLGVDLRLSGLRRPLHIRSRRHALHAIRHTLNIITDRSSKVFSSSCCDTTTITILKQIRAASSGLNASLTAWTLCCPAASAFFLFSSSCSRVSISLPSPLNSLDSAALTNPSIRVTDSFVKIPRSDHSRSTLNTRSVCAACA